MASEKISQMPPAVGWHTADIIPGVQGGANVQATRDVFLQVAVGDRSGLTDTTGTWWLIDTDGSLQGHSDHDWQYLNGSGTGFKIAADGTCYFNMVSGKTWSVIQGATSLEVDGAGNLVFNSPTFTVGAGGPNGSIYIDSSGVTIADPTNTNGFFVGTDGSCYMTAPTAYLQMPAGGGAILSNNDNSTFYVSYFPNATGHWTHRPTDLGGAIDKIAAAWYARFGAIP